ncbi:unnamed protein product [Microthlaspi erraticum]|uniref:Ubiquitin-like protease family profile domain-containing protein n=1 Tax=Microthlaspi erraticum TaxID=1685480 RepID=A0A6D2K0U9_9BRAS|nr:unnamed protein product [Microthlaspi erraticum]
MEKVKFPRRLYSHGDEPKPGKSISYYSNDSQLFPALKSVLKEDKREELVDSKLGVFLKFHLLKFGWVSRVVQFILGFQLVCKKKYEIWSLIGASPLRFSLNEFEHLTGLTCDYVENLEEPEVGDEASVLKEMTRFWGQLGVPLETGPSVQQLTEACKFAGEWSREDRLRLGYLSIYAGFIEARKRCSPTRVSMAKLVVDLDKFENYPWGRVAFKNLITSVKSATETKSNTLVGFAEVLQVWAYSAMPEFDVEYGNPLPNNPTPPVVAYSGCRGRKYIKLAMLRQTSFNYFDVREMEDMFPVWDDEIEDVLVENIIKAKFGEFTDGVNWRWKPSDWQLKGAKVGLQPTAAAKSGKKRSAESDGGSQKMSCEESPHFMDEEVLTSVTTQIKLHFEKCINTLSLEMKSGREACNESVKVLTGKVEAVQNTIAKMKEGRNEEQVKSNDAPPKEDAPPPRKKQQAPCESVNGKECSVIFVKTEKQTEAGFRLHLKRQQSRAAAAHILAQAKVERKRRLASSQIHPFIGNSTARTIIPNQDQIPRYDPMDPVDKNKLAALKRFIKQLPGYPSRDPLRFPQRNWWWLLLTKPQWLVDTHMDAVINMLRFRQSKHPAWFRSDRLYFVDTNISLLWGLKFIEFVESEPTKDGLGRLVPAGASDYYFGEKPAYCRTDKHWIVDIDDIYLPLNIRSAHWIALWISLPRRHITIWDSLPSYIDDEELASFVEPVAVIVPYLLLLHADVNKRDKFPFDRFTHERMIGPGFPIQDNDGDCGIKAIREKLGADIFDEIKCLGPPNRVWSELGLYDS